MCGTKELAQLLCSLLPAYYLGKLVYIVLTRRVLRNGQLPLSLIFTGKIAEDWWVYRDEEPIRFLLTSGGECLAFFFLSFLFWLVNMGGFGHPRVLAFLASFPDGYKPSGAWWVACAASIFAVGVLCGFLVEFLIRVVDILGAKRESHLLRQLGASDTLVDAVARGAEVEVHELLHRFADAVVTTSS